MADESGDQDDSGLRFPPVPLVSGTTIASQTGGPVAIESVEVVVTAADGTQQRTPLQPRHGAWWAPPQA